LLKLGCKVILIDKNEQELHQVAKFLKNHYPESFIYSFKLDLTSIEDIQRVSNAIKSKIGDVSIIFNNAGIANGKLLVDLNENEIRNVFNVNILAQFLVCKQFLPKMIELNHGHIINISSACGLMGAYKLTDYSATKFAINGFTESLRIELQTLNSNNKIKTSLVCPFHVQTKLFNGVEFKYLKWLGLSMTPEYVVDCIIHGMLLDKEIIYIPRFILILMTILKA
jgi:short-subunit dehydrogenase